MPRAALHRGDPARTGGLGGVEDFLHEYALSTKEGLALMVLAEALLRVPDDATADLLIEDKLSAADFSHHAPRSGALLVSASAWALGITARIVGAHETPETIIDGLVKRLGQPAVRAATRQAMRLLASHFVLGETIGEALHAPRVTASFCIPTTCSARAPAPGGRRALHAAYAHAIEAIGHASAGGARPGRPGFGQALGAASALRAVGARAGARRIAGATA